MHRVSHPQAKLGIRIRTMDFRERNGEIAVQFNYVAVSLSLIPDPAKQDAVLLVPQLKAHNTWTRGTTALIYISILLTYFYVCLDSR